MDCQEFSRGSARGLPRHGLADLVSFDLRLRARGSLGSPQVGPGVRIRASVRSREKRRAAGTSTRNAEHASAWRPAAAWQLGCCFQCRLEKGVQARPMGTAAAAARKLACVMTQLTTCGDPPTSREHTVRQMAPGTPRAAKVNLRQARQRWLRSCWVHQCHVARFIHRRIVKLLALPLTRAQATSTDLCSLAELSRWTVRKMALQNPRACVDDSSSKPSSFTGGTTTTLVSLYRRLRPSANLLQT